MKRKFTFLIAAALMLLTMMATTGTMWGQETVTATSSNLSANVSYQDLESGKLIEYKNSAGNSYSNPIRIYANNTFTIHAKEGVARITEVAIVANNTSYASTTNNATWTATGTGTCSASSSVSGSNVTVTISGEATTITCKPSAQVRWNQLSVTYITSGSSSLTSTTVTIDASGLTNTDVYVNTEAGSLSATVKDDENNSIDGATVTWTSSATGIATIDADGEVTLVSAGKTTITASYAGNSTYSPSFSTYELTVTSSEPYNQPTNIEIIPNYTFWGKTGQFSGGTFSELSGSKDNVSLYWTKGEGSTYANLTAMRFYKDNTLVFTAPTGYEIKSIVLTVSGTYNDLAFSPTGFNTDNTTWTGSAETVTMSRPSTGSSYATISQYTITIGAASSLPTPTITIDATGITNTNVFAGTDAGSLSATVTYNDETVQGATVTWSGNNNAVATIDENSGAVTLVAAGSVTFTATFAGNESYNSATAQHVMTVTNDDPNAPGTVNNPYTVAAAMAAIDAQGTINEAYVTGIVSQVDSYNSSYHSITYWISDDGETTTQLEVYSGKGLNGADFSSVADVQVGATVVVKGKLKLYNQTYEFDYNNELVSYTAPVVTVEAPTFSVAAGGYAEAQTVEIACATEGAIIKYSYDNETWYDYSEALAINETKTVYAKAIKDASESAVASAAYYILSDNNKNTVADALAFESYPQNNIFVEGIVSTAPTSLISGGMLTYYISADGTTTNQLQIYKGKNLGNAAFTDAGEIVAGDRVTVFGNVKIYNNTTEFDQGNYLITLEGYTYPVINADNINIAHDATSGTINYTVEHYLAGTMTASTEADWISNFNTATNGQVSFTTTANPNEEARVAQVTLTFTDITENFSTKVVTVTQAPHVNDCAELPFWFNGIRDEIATTAGLTQYGLGEDFISSTELFLNFDDEGDWVVLKTNEAPGRVSFTISNQGFSGGTFKVQTSADGETYSDLAVYTSIDGQQYDTYYNFDENVRYIKWIYTTNGNGSVGLGTISVAKFVSPIRVITAVAPHNEIDTLEFSSAQEFGSLWLYLDHLYVESTDQFSVAFCHADGTLLESNEEAPDWLFTTGEYYSLDHPSSESSKCSYGYNIDANTSYEPREAYLRFKCVIDETSYYSLPVTVTQAGYVPATVTVNPDVVEVTAEGGDGSLEVAYENFTPTFAYTIYFCDANGEEATYDWIQAEMTDEYNIHYEIDANDGEARTAYFKVNAYTHSIYSNLVTINQAAPVTPSQEVTDVLNNSFTGITGTTYSAWTNTGTSGAVYAGNSAGGNDAIQLRSNNSNSGIVTTTSGGKVTKVEVTWNGNTSSGRKIDIYGKNTAYEAASDLYGDNQGTKLGTIEYDNNTALIITDDYEFIGIRSNSGALYLDEIQITWSTGSSTEPSITVADATVEVPAEGEDNGILALTYANLTIIEQGDFDIQYYDENGDELGKDDQPDWMEASIQAAAQEGYEVSFGVVENDGEARTAYFKVYAFDDNDEIVYSNLVTISQAAYVAPTATITVADGDANIDVDVNGVENATLAIAYENLTITENTDFDIQYYDENGDELGKDDQPDWMEASIQENSTQDGYEVSYSVVENDGEARTAYFKVFAMGSEDFVYSNLVTINQAAYVPPVVTDDYELFSGNLEEGDYLIVYNNVAMNNTVTNDRLQYSDVTIDNNVISTSDAAIVWHIAPSGDYWTIYNAAANAYAASTGAKNKAQMLADGTDDKALWSVESTSQSETYDFVNKQNTTNNVNAILRNNKDTNNNYGFACYANSTGGALSLYKKVDNTPSLSFNGSSANIGTYAVGEEIVWDNITITQHNLTENISLSAKKGTVNPASIVAGAEPTEVAWSYTPTADGYTTDTITATSGTLQATLIIQFMVKIPHDINTVAEHGTIVVLNDKTTAIENENIDFTVTPDEGYELNEITVMAGEAPVDFNDYETFYRFQMPDSYVTINATFNELPKYTIKFYVNGDQDESLTNDTVILGNSTPLPTESTLTPAGFAIAGWAELGSTIAVPDPYTPTDNVDLYALFQLDNAQTTSGNYVKVTEELTDWSGEYLIVYEDGNVAFNGNLETFDAVENTVNVEIASSTIIANDAMNNASFTIAPMTGGYSIQGTSGKYIGVGSYANGLTTNDDPVANAISIDESGNALITITFTGGDMTLKYNDAENQLRFRYYKSGQKDIQLYKKVSTSFNNVVVLEESQTMSTSIQESTCVVVPNNVTLTYTGPNPSTPEALVVQEGGQLIHESDVEATVQIGVSGYNSKSGDGWYLISSPVDNLPTSSVATGTYDLFAYDEATAYWWVDHAIPGQPANHTFTTLERGKGYLYANEANVNLNYAGTMKATNANIKVDLSYACDEYPDLKGFNLVGNPFTRNLAYGDMTIIGGEVATSYLILNNDEDYEECNLLDDDEIKPGQGFFIQATASNQQLEFNPSSKDMSVIGLVSIKAGDENYTDKAYIQFGGGNTLRKMTFGEKSQVYVMNDDLDYATARVEELAGTMPVHFVPIEDGFYTITVETKNIENLNYMHLIDNIKNTEIDLLVEPSYTFKASESDNADRFYLVFDFNNYTGVNENYTNDNFAHQIGDEIFVSGEGTLQVFDVLGRFVTGYSINGDKRISTAEFNTGVYIFRMVGTEVKTQKIIVR